MTNYIITIVLIALSSGFIITLLRKWGVVEYMQVHGDEILSQMFNCNFCLSWWASVLVAIPWAVISGEPEILAAPLFSTMITRQIL